VGCFTNKGGVVMFQTVYIKIDPQPRRGGRGSGIFLPKIEMKEGFTMDMNLLVSYVGSEKCEEVYDLILQIIKIAYKEGYEDCDKKYEMMATGKCTVCF
jgi:hypothetical protein